jgi:hypothetical protein
MKNNRLYQSSKSIYKMGDWIITVFYSPDESGYYAEIWNRKNNTEFETEIHSEKIDAFKDARKMINERTSNK